jgi:adenylate cyclase
MRRVQIPFYLALLAVVLGLVLTLTVVMGVFGWRAIHQLEIAAVSEQFEGYKDRFATILSERVRAAAALQRELAQDRALKAPSYGTEEVLRNGRRLAEAVAIFEAMNSFYFGYADGGFLFGTLLERMPPEVQERLRAPEDAHVLVRHISPDEVGTRMTLTFLDGAGNILEVRPIDSKYDARKRPWYQLAVTAEGPALTQPYLFPAAAELGISLVQPLADGKGVIGGDFLLKNLSRLVFGQRISESSSIALFFEDGMLFAHPDPEELIDNSSSNPEEWSARSMQTSSQPVLRVLYETLAARQGEPIKVIDVSGRDYATFVDRIDIPIETPVFLAFTAPVDEINASSRALVRTTVGITLMAVLIAVLAIVAMSRLLASPIKRLALATERIGKLDFTSAVDVGSRIREVGFLSDSLERMRHGLDLFGRYVPRQLVHRIVENPEAIEIGGERRPITVLFSDIAGYTSIAESLPPELLFRATSAYFSHVGRAVMDHGGVIDKYIGDSVMAFWNAPDRDAEHVAKACHAALSMRKAEQAYNQEAERKDWPRFHTRIGLHTGEGIVGNVGSYDRMNYTLVGAVVNLSSRLEGMNKVYGTSILVSHDVCEAAGEAFIFRIIDRVVAVGTTEPVRVYELLATKEELSETERADLTTVLDRWNRAMTAYLDGKWPEALSIFEALVSEREEDLPARHLRDKIQNMSAEDLANWTGATQSQEK